MNGRPTDVGQAGLARLLLSFLLTLLVSVQVGAEQELMIGSIVLRLGDHESDVIQRLTTEHVVDRIDGGLSVNRRDADRSAPTVGIKTTNRRIRAVSIIWQPGFNPTIEEITKQLAQALPAQARCDIRTVTMSQEGTVVRTLEWSCGAYRVSFVAGREGDSTGISIEKR